MTNWIAAIENRIIINNYANYIVEFTNYLQSFVNLAEHVRSDTKLAIDKAGDSEKIRNLGGTDNLREQWNMARETANKLIYEWESLLKVYVIDGSEIAERMSVRKILTIGD